MAGKSTKEEKPPVAGAVAEKVDRTVDDEVPEFPDSPARVTPKAQVEEVVYEFEPDPDPDKGPKEPAAETPAAGDGTSTKVITDAEKVTNLQKAIKQERGKRRSVLAELEQTKERLRLSDAQSKVVQSEAAKAEREAKLDEAVDIKQALPHITEAVRADLDPYIASARRAGLKASERVSRLIHEDYDKVLNESGVSAAVTINPATGKPPDPVMWRMLVLESDDPAEDAYQLAQDILEQRAAEDPSGVKKVGDTKVDVVLDTTGGDRADGRREVLETISTNADRPRGIGSLPAAEGRVVRKLTPEAISKMPDEEYARLPQHIRDAYLAGGQL